MIGVVASAEDLQIAAEFFELFKTPWEPAVPAKHYRVVLSAAEPVDDFDAELFVIYGVDHRGHDSANRVLAGPTSLAWKTTTLPIYGSVALFGERPSGLTHDREAADCRHRIDGSDVHRIGYNLFAEIRTLLVTGQPPSNAATPTLDLHISVLRSVLIDAGASFVEIPARPDGFDFVCCLTHDVDFFGIRRHGLDRTTLGFLLRGTIGSLVDAAAGRRTWRDAFRNWTAALSLPLVWLKLVDDFWNPFADYAPVTATRPSTFFLVPFRDRPGLAPDGTIDRARGVAYQISDVLEEARAVVARGNELAIHGIDAWRDAEAGTIELNELPRVDVRDSAGVRMHWLYFSADSPQLLERAGFAWDSTAGYNDAIGYHAGTSMAFRPLGADRLLELPLTIMDSAMFYPRRMGLSQADGLQQCQTIVKHARDFGGAVVVNWHDRSLAPERLWGWCYQQLVTEIESDNRAWFATMSKAVEWFSWRRSISFTADSTGTIRVSAPVKGPDVPGGRVLIHRVGNDGTVEAEECRFDGTTALGLSL
jgi:hypothetical protein